MAEAGSFLVLKYDYATSYNALTIIRSSLITAIALVFNRRHCPVLPPIDTFRWCSHIFVYETWNLCRGIIRTILVSQVGCPVLANGHVCKLVVGEGVSAARYGIEGLNVGNVCLVGHKPRLLFPVVGVALPVLGQPPLVPFDHWLRPYKPLRPGHVPLQNNGQGKDEGEEFLGMRGHGGSHSVTDYRFGRKRD